MKRMSYPFLLYALWLGCFAIMSYPEAPLKHEGSQRQVERLFQESKKAIELEDWDEALEKLQLLNLRYKKNPYLEEAKLSIVFCYMEKKDYPEALKLIEKFIAQHSDSDWLVTALRMQTKIKQNTKDGRRGSYR